MTDKAPIKILVVDDEQIARQGVMFLLKRSPYAFIIEEASNGVEAIEKIENFSPDIVMLDIEMPMVSGIEVIMAFEQRNFRLIFATAHPEFALQAFEENACDYLLKPYTDERFYRALDKAIAEIGTQNSTQKLDKFIRSENVFLKRVAVKIGARVRMVDCSSIIYFCVHEQETIMVLKDARYPISHSLSYLENNLPSEIFLRIHRNTIVNKKAIEYISFNNRMSFRMHNGDVVPVAKERQAAIRKLITDENIA